MSPNRSTYNKPDTSERYLNATGNSRTISEMTFTKMISNAPVVLVYSWQLVAKTEGPRLHHSS
jgi:hypothetical protein